MVPLSAAELNDLYVNKIAFPVIAWAGVRDGITVAIGGLAWRFGRCDLWFDVLEPGKVPTISVVRWARRLIGQARQLGEKDVFCFRDEHPRSAKLLSAVGMHMIRVDTATMDDGSSRELELWGT